MAAHAASSMTTCPQRRRTPYAGQVATNLRRVAVCTAAETATRQAAGPCGQRLGECA